MPKMKTSQVAKTAKKSPCGNQLSISRTGPSFACAIQFGNRAVASGIEYKVENAWRHSPLQSAVIKSSLSALCAENCNIRQEMCLDLRWRVLWPSINGVVRVLASQAACAGLLRVSRASRVKGLGSARKGSQNLSPGKTVTVMRMEMCSQVLDVGCFDPDLAYHLKLVAVAVVFFTGSIGVALPLLGRALKFLRLDGNLFSITKAFAAGVILSTGFVHILPDAQEALSNPCLPEWPWSQFPFAGFVAMFAALVTLLIETVGTEYYETRHSHSHGHLEDYEKVSQPVSILDSDSPHEPLLQESARTLVVGKTVHPSSVIDYSRKHEADTHSCNRGVDEEAGNTVHHVHHGFVDHLENTTAEQSGAHIRNTVVSQVLEVAVIAHSFIIGLSLGVSENPCAIKPLLAALSFHQFFEGFALGGCFSQAGFKGCSAFMKAGAFAVTTPIGIITGILVASSYQADTARALIVEGLFDAASAGILIYMALVDLIAADFLSDRMRTNVNLKCMAFLALFGGTMCMSAIAFWL